VEVAAEKNSTLVLPFPVELLRFLEAATPGSAPTQQAAAEPNVIGQAQNSRWEGSSSPRSAS
jgi:hypothetical protein